MASVIVGTWTLLSSSAHIIKGAKQMTKRIKDLLQPGCELSEHDRRRLLCVQKRVEALVPPLNFCVMWSKDKDSCIQPIISAAQEFLQNVCDFIERYKVIVVDGRPRPGLNFDEKFSETLDFFLQELDFICSSVNLAVSIAHHTIPTFTRPRIENRSCTGPAISPSALLRASKRIQEMHNHSGDVCVCTGELYQLRQRWVLVFSSAVFKVVRGVQTQNYAITIMSGTPLISQRQRFIETQAANPSANRTALRFNITEALEVELTTSSALDLPETTEAHGRSLDSLDSPAVILRYGGQKYAFVFGSDNPARARDSLSGIARSLSDYESFGTELLSPLDVVYLVKLCILENGSAHGEQPAHIAAADQLLDSQIQ